jgi:hypothetical protein
VSCHRVEAWDAAGHHVRVPGGQRRPVEHPQLAAWRVVARSLAGELGPIVGECAGCGLPLTAEPGSDLPGWSWQFDLPEGPVTVLDGRFVPPTDDLGGRLERLHRRGWNIRPATWLFQGSLMTLMLAPLALWVFAVVYVSFFLVNYW